MYAAKLTDAKKPVIKPNLSFVELGVQVFDFYMDDACSTFIPVFNGNSEELNLNLSIYAQKKNYTYIYIHI